MDGRTVGHYRLIRLIGKGRDSRVYLGEHVALNRKVAVKLLSPQSASTAEQKARLAKEAAILAKVEHANVVRVYDFGLEGELPYIAMEYVEGTSLWDRVRTQGALAPAAWAEVALDVFQGLEAVHRTGLLHRDVKPGNILIASDGPAKLVDFGLAAEVREQQSARAGRLVGTPGYLAPETVAGEPADARSDLYSAGGALYYAATGRVPFAGRTPREILQKQLEGPPAAPRDLAPQFPAPYETLLLALLSQEPGRRPASASEAIKALATAAGGLPLRVREKKRIVVVQRRSGPLGVVAVLAAAGIVCAAAGVFLANRKAPAPSAAPPSENVSIAPPSPPVDASPPAPPPRTEEPAPEPARATASVLALRQGSHLAGLVEFDGERYVIRTDGSRYVLGKDEVLSWYRSSQEMAADAGPRLEEARRLYGLAKQAEQPGGRAALVREAIHQAEAARDGFALARRFFPGDPDAWLDGRMRETFELLRLIRDVEAVKVADAPPAAVDPPPPPPAPKQEPEAAKAVAPKKAPEGKPGRALPPGLRDGLVWLGRHQELDGRWTVVGHMARCERPDDRCAGIVGRADYDTGVTALAVLSILGVGIGLEDQDSYEGVNLGECLRRGVESLLQAQDASGRIGPEKAQKPMYNHALALH
ncbi:MAG TPA: serine/threonine-protein kinase, partial [Planctomycetota bacterium]|nr:serine/threonine-protein kinase [Planctomycetota bacterium]